MQKEASRIYGPLNFPAFRVASKDHYFKKIPIKKGTNISVFSVSTHFD
jgi:cytochrome P450